MPDDDLKTDQLATEATHERTVGQAIANLNLSDALAYGGLLLVIIGSLGTWVTAGIVSASGFSGDGKWMALLAVLVAFGFYRGRKRAAQLGFLLLLAWSIYEFVHITHEATKVTLFGQHVVHVGWGVYVVILGAAGGLAAAWRRS